MLLNFTFCFLFIAKVKILCLKFQFLTVIQLSPAAPAAAQTTPERPSLPAVRTAVAAARITAHWPTSPLVVFVGAGSAPPL